MCHAYAREDEEEIILCYSFFLKYGDEQEIRLGSGPEK